MKVALVGATGMVGGVMLKVLEEQGFPITELIPVASESSKGKKIHFNGSESKVVTIDVALLQNQSWPYFLPEEAYQKNGHRDLQKKAVSLLIILQHGAWTRINL